MREILFRGKDVDTGEWVYGYYSGPVGACECHEICNINDVLGSMVDVDPETVGQFTGLMDKHGKKIFEGDIVRAVLPKTNAISEFVWPNMVVGFSEGAFVAMRGRYCTPLYSFAPAVEFEVIGNVHDNQELAEDE